MATTKQKCLYWSGKHSRGPNLRKDYATTRRCSTANKQKKSFGTMSKSKMWFKIIILFKANFPSRTYTQHIKCVTTVIPFFLCVMKRHAIRVLCCKITPSLMIIHGFRAKSSEFSFKIPEISQFFRYFKFLTYFPKSYGRLKNAKLGIKKFSADFDQRKCVIICIYFVAETISNVLCLLAAWYGLVRTQASQIWRMMRRWNRKKRRELLSDDFRGQYGDL